MITSSYGFAAPRTAREAAALLARHGGMALAGGQTLVAELATGEAAPPFLVDLGRIESLRGIEPRGGSVRIGAMTTLAELAAHRAVPPVLATAARNVPDPLVRNRATVGGSLRPSGRASDLAPALLALGATVHVTGADSAVTLPAEEYLARSPAGVLSAVDVPVPGPADGCAVARFADRPARPPLCAVAVRATFAGDRLGACRIGVSAGGPAQRPTLLERSLERGGDASPDTVRGRCAEFVSAAGFATDGAASADYRAHLVRTLVVRAFDRIAARRVRDGG
ncbi:FAD binding domain-containing protein [Actinomadura fibrosa]|uniref:FAD binding domain-containing protein n=1 Tax=Actinomadura fibrosa TaxID=111802 RepID=A0ABW2XT85_9ACTN|nr:FAD binding domain-containing protein [Actinomadura fibrosa]